MTKKELFEILENCPDDAEVYIDMQDDDKFENDNRWIATVRDPSPDIKWVKDGKITQIPYQETAGGKKSIIL